MSSLFLPWCCSFRAALRDDDGTMHEGVVTQTGIWEVALLHYPYVSLASIFTGSTGISLPIRYAGATVRVLIVGSSHPWRIEVATAWMVMLAGAFCRVHNLLSGTAWVNPLGEASPHEPEGMPEGVHQGVP